MSNNNRITLNRSIPVSKDRVWSFMTDTNQLSIYFPFIKSSFSEQVRLDTVRVSVVYWEYFYGTFRERCIEWEPKQRVMWRVEEDSMRVFPTDFIWGFSIEETGTNQSYLHFIMEFKNRNRIRSFIESFRLKRLLKTAMDNIQTKLK